MPLPTLQSLSLAPLVNSVWKHYKGHKCLVTSVGWQTETGEVLIGYLEIESGRTFYRPLSMWHGDITVNGVVVPRFEFQHLVAKSDLDTNKMRQVASCLYYNDSDKNVAAAKHMLIEGSMTLDHRNKLIQFLIREVEDLIAELPTIPAASCSCHISPPCNDCVEWSHLREVVASAHDCIKLARP